MKQWFNFGNGANTQLAKVHLTPRALERIVQGALRYPDDETGEALVGLQQAASNRQAFPESYILDTISPSAGAIRQWAMFVQGGDEWQYEVFKWLNENWELQRELGRAVASKVQTQTEAVGTGTQADPAALWWAKWDLPLVHLGDWHKQPGMVQPSSGDFMTAKNFMDDNGLDYLLTPIATLASETEDQPNEANTLFPTDVNSAIRLDFWGISRWSRHFIPLQPVINAEYAPPSLPEVVWWLADQRRMSRELDALEDAGYQVLDIAQHNADGQPPLETCLTLHQPTAEHYLIAITPHTYPQQAPLWRTSAGVQIDDNAGWLAMYAASRPLPPQATSTWDAEAHTLADGAKLVEAYLPQATNSPDASQPAPETSALEKDDTL